MSTIFDLHAATLADYRDFVRSFLFIADERARAFVEQALEEEGHLWPEPLVQLSPVYAPGPTVDELAREGVIAHETARIFCHSNGTPFRLYRHQEEAIRKVLSGESIVVTSGTGSGKSLCYFLPIVESLVRRPDTGGAGRRPRGVSDERAGELAVPGLEQSQGTLRTIAGAALSGDVRKIHGRDHRRRSRGDAAESAANPAHELRDGGVALGAP